MQCLFSQNYCAVLKYCNVIWFALLLQELRDENGRLYKLLGEKEEEMKIFKRRWQNEKKDLTGTFDLKRLSKPLINDHN